MKTLFNDNWTFAKYPLETEVSTIFDNTASFEAVDIPHDWMIGDTANLYTTNLGCYRKNFLLTPQAGKRYSLLFDGVYMDSTIYINGQKAGEWKYGYTSFLIDITDFVKAGENTVFVSCRYQNPNTRWYSGAGIYRDVHFVETDELHLVHNGVYLTAKPAEGNAPTVEKPGKWTLNTSVEVIFESSNASSDSFTIKNVLLNAEGAEVCRLEGNATISSVKPVSYAQVSIDPVKYATVVKNSVEIDNPVLWDIDTPYLYTLKTTLFRGLEEVETVESPLGFRSIVLDSDKGFFLNGKHVKLNGACMHHDLGALGSAFNVTALERQFKSLRKMGINAIRTSHNPVAEPYLYLADKFGMLIDSEFADMWERNKTTYDYANYFRELCPYDAASWLRRDRNHPCVIMWSIGNEIYDTYFEEEGVPITRRLAGFVRFHDPDIHAYSTIGSNYIEWESAQKCATHLDASGYNYAERLYNMHHEAHPEWVIYGSETASTVQSRGIYHFPASQRLLTHDDLQCSNLGNCSTNWGARDTQSVIIMDRDAKFSLGQFIWTGWDYIGEPTPYFTKNSYFGQADTAGFEKDTYYIYQSGWTDYKKSPMVHIMPYWDFNEGQIIDVQVYSNAPKIELFFNEKSLGTVDIDHENGKELAGRWQLPYTKGVLKALAYDEAGQIIATDISSSFGDTARLELTADKTELSANGEDMIFIEIKAVDENGVFVANARNRVNVSVSGAGRLVGLDNGDSTDYEQYKCTSRKLFSGKLLAMIAAGKDAGEITVSVASPSLPDATLKLNAKAATVRQGISCNYTVPTSAVSNEVPVRKIELANHGSFTLTKEVPSAELEATILPLNTTNGTLCWKALIDSGIEANFVQIKAEGNKALVTAIGDGEFKICCYATNGADHPEVISEYNFKAEGLGHAGLNAYELVASCLRSRESNDADINLSFQGGVFTQGGRSWLQFDNVEFGDYGSDEITIPIFHWDPKVQLEIWEGCPNEGGELLLACTYEHESIYNQYSTNTFKLPKRLRGTKTLSIVTFARISLQGFYFTKYEKAFAEIPANEANGVTGDSFKVCDEGVTQIGNNVTIEFKNMDFGEKGCHKITLLGRTPNNINAVHLDFYDSEGRTKQMVEFKHADNYEKQTFEIEPVYGNKTVALIFLPGTVFDLKTVQFE